MIKWYIQANLIVDPVLAKKSFLNPNNPETTLVKTTQILYLKELKKGLKKATQNSTSCGVKKKQY